METIKKFDRRAFTSIALLISAIILPLSILMRHWPVFENSKQAKHLFTSVHATSGLFFTLLLVVHLILNRKALKKYFVKDSRSIAQKNVFAAVAIVIFIIVILSSWELIIQ